MTTLPLSDLVFDYDLYPRVSIDSQHTHYMHEALKSGVTLPPIIIDSKSKRVIDGFHRGRAYRAIGCIEVECEERTYSSDKDMFSDAMRLNASHGRSLTKYDRARCVLKSKKFRMSAKAMAIALGMSVAALSAIGEGRVATADNKQVPIKRTISHMAGKILTGDQQSANEKLSGMNQIFYINQILLLLENDLIEPDNEDIVEKLNYLRARIDDYLATV